MEPASPGHDEIVHGAQSTSKGPSHADLDGLLHGSYVGGCAGIGRHCVRGLGELRAADGGARGHRQRQVAGGMATQRPPGPRLRSAPGSPRRPERLAEPTWIAAQVAKAIADKPAQ